MVSVPRRAERGYNLVVLVMVIAVMNILVAAMLPLWSQAIRHDKEEELIFRGLQYAEAIRVFQRRFQRPPNTLEELVEIKPRSIRQLWKDPMTDDGKWQLIHVGDLGGPINVPPPGGDLNPPPPRGNRGRTPRDRGLQPATGIDQQGHSLGPLIGVHSRSTKKSIEIWNGRQKYDEWRFTVDLLGGGAQIPGARIPGAQGQPQRVRWIGRPMRLFGGGFQPQAPGGPGGPPSMPGSPGVPPPPPPKPHHSRG
jgi:type II secretory pathway pseudopilin PulG